MRSKPGAETCDWECPDELVGGGECHDLLAVATIGAIVLPPEGDAGAVAGDQPTVGDGDAVGIARQIGQHGLWPAERALGIDHPFGSAQRCQIRRERLQVGETGMIGEELQMAGFVGPRSASPGTTDGTGARAHALAGRSRAGKISSFCRRARCRHPARSCGRGDDG